ncbi:MULTISPECIES: hypothetical protein [Nitrosococcus]|uniref:Outer membrane efflux protein n=3 Tax=Nitrosococcus TaxID=1227 RepID=Q3JF47_NITOC|nr:MULTISPECIES: hypothetical protein [Nitrosococcus]ABA56549.1 hypothetical protein Noc_A0036 [Nitrosococcus oceani ATCC 19707]ADJ29880.1 conserved hypothetical protein [Nitrosococcus watsonii C-113]KFI17770.1 hypothetical protein IB75_18600 [Nitrosococcus oceani C-27]
MRVCWKKSKRAWWCGLLLLPAWAGAWQEQAVLEFILASNPLLRAYQGVTREYAPPTLAERLLERTSLFARASTDGGSLQATDSFFTTGTTAGVQIYIPLISRQENREHALRTLEETRALEQTRNQALQGMAQLRVYEADLAAAKTQLQFYRDKSGWAQQRVESGYEEVENLWTLAQKLNEAQASVEKLALLIASQRQNIAAYAGPQWPSLLAYLKGEGGLPGDEAHHRTDGPRGVSQFHRQGTAQGQARAPERTGGGWQVGGAGGRTGEASGAGGNAFP